MGAIAEFIDAKVARSHKRRTLDEKRHATGDTLSSGCSVAEIASGYELNANHTSHQHGQYPKEPLGTGDWPTEAAMP